MTTGRRRAGAALQTKKIGVFPLIFALATLAGYHVTDVTTVAERQAPCLGQQTVDGVHVEEGGSVNDGYRTHAITLTWMGKPLAPLDGVGAPPPAPPFFAPDDEASNQHQYMSKWENRTLLYTEWTSPPSPPSSEPLLQPKLFAAAAAAAAHLPGGGASSQPSASADASSLNCLLPEELMEDIKTRANAPSSSSGGSGLAASLRGAEFELFSDNPNVKKVQTFFAEHADLILQDDTGLPFERAIAMFREVSLMGSFVGPSIVPLFRPVTTLSHAPPPTPL